MRKLFTVVATLGLVLAAASPADLLLGEERLAYGQKKGDKPKVKTYDFTGDTIEGDLIKPEGEGINARDITQFASLIRIRTHFIDEIIKAAENL
jgi:hypothetical protein